ncbi:MAG: polymer-forming cytoskeletal protein [Proteobacteria bacterium]|nr:polymer-forming cytoskeletal protein [Pseudomonadota bacterium]
MNESRLRRMRDRSLGTATLISDSCKISGDITGKGDFWVNGEIVGDCDIDGTVTLAGSGFWQGAIRADNIVIAGHVEGDIAARGKVEITATARIAGTVSGEAIAVAEGAIVEGIMKTTGPSEPQAFVEKRDS